MYALPMSVQSVPPYLTAEQLEQDIGTDISQQIGMPGTFALKSMPDRMACKVDTSGQNSVAVVNDVHMLASINHRSILRCHSVIHARDHSHIYIVTDTYAYSLERVAQMRRRGTLPLSLISLLSLMHQMADALAYFHDLTYIDPATGELRHVYYGNISSTSVIFSADSRYCVLMQPRFYARLAGQHEACSTSGAHYVAPEVKSGGSDAVYTRQSDMWSLGMAFCELAAGPLQRSVNQDMKQVWREHLAAVLPPGGVSVLDKVLKCLLTPEPSKRITARELTSLLGQLLERVHEYTLHGEVIDDSAKQQTPGATDLIRASESGSIDLVRKYAPYQAGQLTIDAEQMCGWGLRGRTALMGAALLGHTEIARLLAPYEAGLHQHYDGTTALMMAASKGHVEIVKALLDYEKGRQDAFGYTALMFAVCKDNLEVAAILAKDEAHIKAGNGLSARKIAEANGFDRLVSMLSAYGDQISGTA